MRNRKWICCLALLMLFLLPVSVSASEDFEDDGAGSLRVLGVRYPVRLHHVAYISGEFTEEFQDCGIFPEVDTMEEDAKKILDFAEQHRIPGWVVTPARKEACFAPLEEGLHLISSLHEPEEFAPFLMPLPMPIDGELVFHIEAKPKVQEFPEETDPTEPPPSAPEETDPTTPPPSDPEETDPTTPPPSAPEETDPTTPPPSDPEETDPTEPPHDDPDIAVPTTPPAGETTPAGTQTESNVIFQAGSSEIPQTGNSVIPKYLLMAMGTLLTLAGLYRVVTEKKENTDD